MGEPTTVPLPWASTGTVLLNINRICNMRFVMVTPPRAKGRYPMLTVSTFGEMFNLSRFPALSKCDANYSRVSGVVGQPTQAMPCGELISAASYQFAVRVRYHKRSPHQNRPCFTFLVSL